MLPQIYAGHRFDFDLKVKCDLDLKLRGSKFLCTHVYMLTNIHRHLTFSSTITLEEVNNTYSDRQY